MWKSKWFSEGGVRERLQVPRDNVRERHDKVALRATAKRNRPQFTARRARRRRIEVMCGERSEHVVARSFLVRAAGYTTRGEVYEYCRET